MRHRELMLNLNYRSVKLSSPPIILFIMLKGLLPPTAIIFTILVISFICIRTNITPIDHHQSPMLHQSPRINLKHQCNSGTCHTIHAIPPHLRSAPPIRTTVIFIFKSQLCLIIVNLSVTHKMLRERVLVGGISTRHMRGKNFRSLVRYLKDKLMQQRQKKLSYCSLFRLPWQRQEAREVTD